jgi:Uma2 family endonuclease
MAAVQSPTQQRFVLYSVPWRTYERLLRIFADRPGVHLTYDRGTLELATHSHNHQNLAHVLGRFVAVLTEELDLPLASGGSTTLRRHRRRRGVDPDECYWITNEALVRSLTKIDLRRDPPPDLALEIDITDSSLDRLSIYAALAIPEVWRLSEQALVFHVLAPDGDYVVQDHSQAFPQLMPSDLMPFLALRGQEEENAIVRQFRPWVRQRFTAGGATAAP